VVFGGKEKIFLASPIERLQEVPGDFWLITTENHIVVFQWHNTEEGFLERGQLIADPKIVNWYQALARAVHSPPNIAEIIKQAPPRGGAYPSCKTN